MTTNYTYTLILNDGNVGFTHSLFTVRNIARVFSKTFGGHIDVEDNETGEIVASYDKGECTYVAPDETDIEEVRV